MITQYVCEACKKVYLSPEEALECESQPLPEHDLNVGDIVLAHSGFSWYDGKIEWVSNPLVRAQENLDKNKSHGNCFRPCCTYSFYYVITKITSRKHKVLFHLETKAMTGEQGYRGGWATHSHYFPKKVDNIPDAIANDYSDLIGHDWAYSIL